MQIGRGGRGLMYRFIAAVSIIVIEGRGFSLTRNIGGNVGRLYSFFFSPLDGGSTISWNTTDIVTVDSRRKTRVRINSLYLTLSIRYITRCFLQGKGLRKVEEGETDFRSLELEESVILRSRC